MSQKLQCLVGSAAQSTSQSPLLLGGTSNVTSDIVSISGAQQQTNLQQQQQQHQQPLLARPSSAITTSTQRFSPLNAKTTLNGRASSQQSHQKLNTPLLPLSSAAASLNAPLANIFFPPPPPPPLRSNGSSNANHITTNMHTNGSNKSSPLCSIDVNMNVAHERNREHSLVNSSNSNGNQQNASLVVCDSANISPNQTRFSTPAGNSKSSKLHSPISVQPSKSFVSFFSEPMTQFPPANLNNNIGNFSSQQLNSRNSSNKWAAEPPQDDNNYHLYHEPIDPDEVTEAPECTGKASELKFSSSFIEQSNNALSSPTWFKNEYQTTQRSDNNSNSESNQSFRTGGQNPSASPTSKTSNNNTARDWAHTMPQSPTTPTVQNQFTKPHQHHEQMQLSSSSGRLTDQARSSKRDDVSADIYFCYVTLKSNERSNHRSRSYQGPKKISNSITSSGLAQNSEVADLIEQMDNQKISSKGLASTSHINFSSTSVTDIPMSPTTFTSTMMPMQFRDHCLRELIETESNYVHALDMILTCFAKPLENVLRREDHQLIFSDVKYFHHIHSSFQTDLVKAAFRNYNRELSDITTSGKVPTSNCSNGRAQTTTNVGPNNLSGIANSNSNVAIGITPPSSNNAQSSQRSPLASPSAQDVKSQGSFNGKIGNGSRISCCFLNIKEKFLKYGDYCANLSKAQALLDELTSKSDFVAQQLESCQQEANEGKFKLRDLLSLPMQRILKYHLLLAQLIKNTSSSNDDYHGLKRAHEAMVDLGQYINEVKRDTEAKQIINDIEQSITGLNMPPNTRLIDYGRLVADGFIRIKTLNDTRSSKQLTDVKLKQKRYIFVFDKVMLMCKLSGVRGYQYKEALVLSEFELEANPSPSISDFSTLKHATKDKWSYGFNLIRSKDKTVFSFYAKTPEMKNKWVSAILKAMDNTKPAACRNNETNHEFLMYSFEKASSCDHCGKLLLGLYYQGYRCQTCFTSVHKRCLTSVRPCGSVLTGARSTTTLPSSKNRFNEPASPSLASNCSDESINAFLTRPSSSRSHFQNSSNQVRKINLSDNDLTQAHNKEHTTNGYVNFILDEYPWFCGRMERDTAQTLLEKMPHGTFLVRVSPRHNGSYVISLNYNGQVKHIRIYVSKDNQLYLSQNRYFKSVIELVSHYKDNSLVESFHMLDARLVTPFKLAQT